MDLQLSEQDERFRDDVRLFLQEKLTTELCAAGRLRASWLQEFNSSMAWHRILYEKGWAAPSWPKAYGGTGWSAMQWFIFENECAKADAPILTPLGLRMLGPMLIGKGSDAQKDYFLPRILSGSEFFCQGYSEPNAGSDLASLQTKAERQGDNYVVNGSKIWTTFAHHADWIFCLVRTSSEGKAQQGISFLLIDMRSPGIEIRPIINIAGEHEFNQVVFSDVIVPQANRVGHENQGWDVAKYLLEFERFRVASPEARRLLRHIRVMVDEEWPIAEKPIPIVLSTKLAQLESRIDALEINEMRNVAALTAGQNPGPESSVLMALQADILQAVTEIGVEVAGPYGLVWQPEALDPNWNGRVIGRQTAITLVPSYLGYRMRTIGGGTAEVQRNIVAKTVLGL